MKTLLHGFCYRVARYYELLCDEIFDFLSLYNLIINMKYSCRLRLLHSLTLSCVLCLFSGCGHEGHESHDHHGHELEHEHDSGHDSEHADEHGDTHGDKHSDEIVLEPAMAEKLGVTTTIVTPLKFDRVISVTGELLGSPAGNSVAYAPTSGTVTLAGGITPGTTVSKGQLIATVDGSAVAGGDAAKVAAATLAETKRELDRMTPLHEEGIVSTRDYNAALRAYEEARAAYSAGAASGRVTAREAGVIASVDVRQGQFVSAGDPVATISSVRELILRADVPQREVATLSQVSDANFKVGYSDDWYKVSELNGHRKSAELSGNSSYIPVYFTISNPGTLIPGTYAEIKLLAPSEEECIAVPVSALSEQQGEKFVYVRTDEHGYRKCPVVTGSSDGTNIEIRSGLNAGEEVVTRGVTAVKLAETSGAVPEGHSHSH